MDRLSLFTRYLPVIFILNGCVSYLGAGLAVGLFASFPAHTVTWLRIGLAGIILLLWRRPKNLSLPLLGAALLFGGALTLMNLCFYEAIARMPLGAAVCLEFFGPVILAVATLPSWRGRLAGLLAGAGVVAISGFGLNIFEVDSWYGSIFALAAGGFWVAYILLGKHVALGGRGMDTLALGTFFGALFLTPFAAPYASPLFFDPKLALLAFGMAVCSSVIPYAVEQIIFRHLSAGIFAVLNALMPATSMFMALIMLWQIPNLGQLAGLILISSALYLTQSRPRK